MCWLLSLFLKRTVLLRITGAKRERQTCMSSLAYPRKDNRSCTTSSALIECPGGKWAKPSTFPITPQSTPAFANNAMLDSNTAASGCAVHLKGLKGQGQNGTRWRLPGDICENDPHNVQTPRKLSACPTLWSIFGSCCRKTLPKSSHSWALAHYPHLKGPAQMFVSSLG